MANNLQYILEENFLITSADTDFSRKLRVSPLINMLIQIAWHHANGLGLGFEYLHTEGLVWMLSRLQIRIEKLPLWNTNLKIITWPKGVRRLFYLRDFTVIDETGTIIAFATSEWLTIDIKARRPKLIRTDGPIFNANLDKHAITKEVPSLKSTDASFTPFKNIVRYSDVDLNYHLTTTRYVDWMFDTYDIPFLNKHNCQELILNFIQEIPFAEVVVLKRHDANKENIVKFEAVNQEKSKVFFRGSIVFD